MNLQKLIIVINKGMREKGCFCGFNSLLAKFDYKHLLKILGTYWHIIQRKITVIGFIKILDRYPIWRP